MALTGKAKTDYQREYMRKRRSNQTQGLTPEPVRPTIPDVRPTRTQPVLINEPEQQSHSPMMVGYVPPKG